MTRFYLSVVQAVLLYGADSWCIKTSDMKRLKSFHHRAMRYMTGEHIRKDGEEWFIPDHRKLLKKCGMAEIDAYIQSRRSTLRGYMETINPSMWSYVQTTRPPTRHNNKILWWKKKVISKAELRLIVKGKEDSNGENNVEN